MADLRRILETFGARDAIAVEEPGQAPSGINAGTDWTRRFLVAMTSEHDGQGVHNTLKIPRAFVRVRYNRIANQYEVDEAASWFSTGNEIALIDRWAEGVILFEYAFAMPSVHGIGAITNGFDTVSAHAEHSNDYSSLVYLYDLIAEKAVDADFTVIFWS